MAFNFVQSHISVAFFAFAFSSRPTSVSFVALSLSLSSFVFPFFRTHCGQRRSDDSPEGVGPRPYRTRAPSPAFIFPLAVAPATSQTPSFPDKCRGGFGPPMPPIRPSCSSPPRARLGATYQLRQQGRAEGHVREKPQHHGVRPYCGQTQGIQHTWATAP